MLLVLVWCGAGLSKPVQVVGRLQRKKSRGLGLLAMMVVVEEQPTQVTWRMQRKQVGVEEVGVGWGQQPANVAGAFSRRRGGTVMSERMAIPPSRCRGGGGSVATQGRLTPAGG